MKKKAMNGTIRLFVIIIISIMFIGLGYMWYKTATTREFVEIEKQGQSYSWEEKIDWQTEVINNPMISRRHLGKDDFIYNDLTDKIKVYFEVPLISTEPMTFTGTTTLKASLMSVYGEEKSVVWEKVDILEEDQVTYEGKQILFSAEEEMNIRPHKEFIKEIEENYLLAGSYLYVFEYEIDGIIESQFGSHAFNIKPKAEFPIIDIIAKGTEVLSTEMSYTDTIKETIEKPININNIRLIQVLMGVLVLIMIVFLVLTKAKKPKDTFDRFAEKFIKEHGDRMVKIPKSLSLQYGNVMTVKEPADMIKAADEINQPIFYYYVNNQEQRKIELFIFDDVRVYYYSEFGTMTSEQLEKQD